MVLGGFWVIPDGSRLVLGDSDLVLGGSGLVLD